jgi:hypothetical protein
LLGTSLLNLFLDPVHGNPYLLCVITSQNVF